jgi:hypothetical protein
MATLPAHPFPVLIDQHHSDPFRLTYDNDPITFGSGNESVVPDDSHFDGRPSNRLSLKTHRVVGSAAPHRFRNGDIKAADWTLIGHGPGSP